MFNSTLFEKLTGKPPNVSNMHVFETQCYIYVQGTKKLDVRSELGKSIRLDPFSPAHLVYFPNRNKIQRVRCVDF